MEFSPKVQSYMNLTQIHFRFFFPSLFYPKLDPELESANRKLQCDLHLRFTGKNYQSSFFSDSFCLPLHAQSFPEL